MKPIEITTSQFNRVVNEFKKYAKEEIEVEFIHNALYVFGSELAILRIAKAYKNTPADQMNDGYSQNSESFYFMLEMPNFTGEMSTR